MITAFLIIFAILAWFVGAGLTIYLAFKLFEFICPKCLAN